MSESHSYGESVSDFRIGDRIELHPATDQWMRGERFGEVIRIGRKYVRVRMNATGRAYRALPMNLRKVN